VLLADKVRTKVAPLHLPVSRGIQGCPAALASLAQRYSQLFQLLPQSPGLKYEICRVGLFGPVVAHC
jgi:hypothetical protein